MYKMYDPVFKFVSENLGDLGGGGCSGRCNCCEYLSLTVGKDKKAWTACLVFVSQMALLGFT